MIKLFLDIETLPAPEDKKEKVIAILSKKKPYHLIHPAISEEQYNETLYLDTSFNGTFGRICCIGYLKENGHIISQGTLSGTEEEILIKFWELSSDVSLFIGHNVIDFDFPFIYKRSIIKSIKPRLDLSFARYRNSPIYDTMHEWAKWAHGSSESLDTLAKVLGFPTSKDKMDGSQVWTYYQTDKQQEINEYCMKDVILTRQVYYKMTFQTLLPE